VVVLTGAVAPHNMVDLADGFKLVEQTPYVHEPVLLATEYEPRSCGAISLGASSRRFVTGRRSISWESWRKLRGDLVLRRCVVL
jgi:hypothetical protein